MRVRVRVRVRARVSYRSLLHRLAPLAHKAGVPLIEQFEGTWAGAAAGLLQHHDSTRIHFSDTGAPNPIGLRLSLPTPTPTQ